MSSFTIIAENEAGVFIRSIFLRREPSSSGAQPIVVAIWSRAVDLAHNIQHVTAYRYDDAHADVNADGENYGSDRSSTRSASIHEVAQVRANASSYAQIV